MNKARFLRHVEQTPGCHFWRGNVNDHGYGRVRVHGRLRAAHRVAYELWVGPIPSGALVGHRDGCDPCCVRPDHLKLIENVVRLSPEQVAAIIQSFLPRPYLAQKYGVSPRHIFRLRQANSIRYVD